MNERPRVSVIMPVYNGRAHCLAALQSVLDQSQPPDEVIVVDDGSSDGSAEVIGGLASPVPLTILRQPNQGQSAARNHGARVATGELLAFIDQDDLWLPRHLEKLTLPFRSRPDLGWAFSDFDEIDGCSRIVTRCYIAQHGVSHPRRTLGGILSSDLMVLPSASVVRARAFQEVGGFDVNLCGYEDDDLFIRVFRAGWDSEFLAMALTRFRIHHTSSSAGARFQQSRIRFLDKLIAEVPNDERMNRYYIRDMAFPRLFQTTLYEYVTALRMREFERAGEIAGTIAELNRRVPGGWRRAIQIALLRRPRQCLPLLQAYRRFPRRIRPRINETLLLLRR